MEHIQLSLAWEGMMNAWLLWKGSLQLMLSLGVNNLMQRKMLSLMQMKKKMALFIGQGFSRFLII